MEDGRNRGETESIRHGRVKWWMEEVEDGRRDRRLDRRKRGSDKEGEVERNCATKEETLMWIDVSIDKSKRNG